MDVKGRHDLTRKVSEALTAEGFDLSGIARAEEYPEDTAHMQSWISLGRHAGMQYLVRNSMTIGNIGTLIESPCSVIVCALRYADGAGDNCEGEFYVSRYARVKDYHLVVKKKLERVAAMISRELPGSSSRVFCDAAPITEKEWALRAGLGWRGKNSLIINENTGSYIFLGEIVTTAELDYNESSYPDRCGSCTKCIEACPTGAICSDRTIDARRCIAYHTIESSEDIPSEFRGKTRNIIFGCDICQEVCPWNKLSGRPADPELSPDDNVCKIRYDEWLGMTPVEFRRRFSSSPILRTGLAKIRKSVLFVSSSPE